MNNIKAEDEFEEKILDRDFIIQKLKEKVINFETLSIRMTRTPQYL